MKIAMIAEGGLELGMGHIEHSMALAKELKDKCEIRFLTTSDQIVVAQLQRSGFDALRLRNDDEVLKFLSEIRPDIVIIDNLRVEKAFAKQIKKELTEKLVIFNNLSNANMCADIAVTADIGSRFENIRRYDQQTGTVYYFGPKYWFLRNEFYEFHQKAKVLREIVESILLIFGGSDYLDLTSTVLDELLTQTNDFKIEVVLGAQFSHFNTLNHVLAKHDGKTNKVNVYRNVRNVAELMYKADLVIASPGLSAFEALCVGTPVIVMPQNSLQKQVYEEYMPTLAKNEVSRIALMISNKDFIDPRHEDIAKLEIGQGRSELIAEILRHVSDS